MSNNNPMSPDKELITKLGNVGQVVVIFHMDNCSHCVKLVELSNNYADKVVLVNCNKYPDIAQINNIEATPTFVFLDQYQDKVSEFIQGAQTDVFINMVTGKYKF